jgi:hypothetical protein
LPVCGSVPERPKGADCKSAGSAFEGSNPSRPTQGKVLVREYKLLSDQGFFAYDLRCLWLLT